MPKVKHYSPAWLSKGSHGHRLFEPSTESSRSRALASPYSSRKKSSPSARRTIAYRGTEAFVAVGKEIRWGDLVYLKEEWASKQSRGRSSGTPRIKREDSSRPLEEHGESENPPGVRTIKTPVADDIKQLIMSPNQTFLAILTSHTVHICILPDSSQLTSEDAGILRPQIFTVGPTTHVTSRASIVSALWHPLGVNGSCLVTVTSDAMVRLWELSATDRWSFDSPSTSVDLKKLADGMTLDQDFAASASATNKGFSPDSFEMEVAAASFATRGSGGWNPMTLWVAMREGDVYALCPLLPQRWSPPPTLIPSLSVSIVATVASLEDDPEVEEHAKLLAQQQMEWMGELDAQEPQYVEGPPEDPLIEVYTRPSRPGVIPRLQGPFDLQSDPETGDDLDTSVTDIMVIGKKTETDELMQGEDEELDLDESDYEGLSLAIVCLLSVSGQVRIYLDYDGVEAQWLPPKNKSKSARLLAEVETPALLAFQAMDTMSPVEVNEESWPTFSPDVTSRYNFYVTHYAAISFISLTSWVFRLEGELNGDSEAGTDFRIGLVVNSQSSRDKVFSPSAPDASAPLAAACAMRDPDLGYFLLSATPYDPIGLVFETPEVDLAPLRREDSPIQSFEPEVAPLDFIEPRPVFQPSHAFEESSALPGLLGRLRTSRHKTVVNQEVRLSPLTLQIFTDAHKVLSDETYRLGGAAAELFRRCEMLQTELRQQVAKANEVKARVDSIKGTQREEGPDNVMFDDRIANARSRQEELLQRLEKLRKTVGKATTRELSTRERAFVEEVRTLDGSLAEQTASETSTRQSAQQKQLGKRLDDVRKIWDDLESRAASIGRKDNSNGGNKETNGFNDIRIPQDIRKSKLSQVQGLLSRETALVEAVTARLERLQTTT